MGKKTKNSERHPQGDFLSEEDRQKWKEALAADDKKLGGISHPGHCAWKGVGRVCRS
tara:strand:- start:224922 stop:225092 length:171 start_codon:yes stop_codon:yes gene_type:complete